MITPQVITFSVIFLMGMTLSSCTRESPVLDTCYLVDSRNNGPENPVKDGTFAKGIYVVIHGEWDPAEQTFYVDLEKNEKGDFQFGYHIVNRTGTRLFVESFPLPMSLRTMEVPKDFLEPRPNSYTLIRSDFSSYTPSYQRLISFNGPSVHSIQTVRGVCLFGYSYKDTFDARIQGLKFRPNYHITTVLGDESYIHTGTFSLWPKNFSILEETKDPNKPDKENAKETHSKE